VCKSLQKEKGLKIETNKENNKECEKGRLRDKSERERERRGENITQILDL